jgi:lysophospholipase L1-like esterase
VVNRGFSGYNTRQALAVLPSVIPKPEDARIRFLVVFFGANDACNPRKIDDQHVPLDEYTRNLETIITHPLIKAHDPRILLVAPPPIDEHLQWVTDKEKGHPSVTRIAATTKSYADGAIELGKKLNVPVVNLWEAFMSKAGFSLDTWNEKDPLPGSMGIPQNDALVELMYDGRLWTSEPEDRAELIHPRPTLQPRGI